MIEHPGFDDHTPSVPPAGGNPSSAVPNGAAHSGREGISEGSGRVESGTEGNAGADQAMEHQDPTDWETVNFPGQRPLGDLELPLQSPEPAPAPTGLNTAELLQLIQDLNQCNDVLLSRISQLEDALEHSQNALQSEVERAQTAAPPPAPASPQLAQLLKELETAQDSLRQVSRHNEVLTTDLNQSHQRIGQIERECTRLQQRLNERSDALHQTETTCRDLRTRLHRQQRYTLQFKVALEKCLNMSAEQSVAPMSQSLPEPTSPPIAMPKAQQIQPWAADPQTPQADASLTHLLRGLKAAGQGLPATPPEPPFPLEPEPTDADAALWQQLERLTAEDAGPQGRGPSQAASPAMADPPAPIAEEVPPKAAPSDPVSDLASDPATVSFTEPSPWGSPLPSPPPPPATPDAANLVADLMAELQATPPPSAAPAAPATADGTDRSETDADPLPMPFAVEPRLTSSRPAVDPDIASATAKAPLPPAVPTAPPGSSAPSPVVYPLRHKKKLGSLAAVQLPNFSQHRRPS